MKKGFTLIELLVAIMIVAILALTVLPPVVNMFGSGSEQQVEIRDQNRPQPLDQNIDKGEKKPL